MGWKLQPAVPSCFWHKAKHTKTNRISRFGLHNCGFRQLPPHMLALVAQLLPNATIKPLQLQQSELVSHVVTTLLKSICFNMLMFPYNCVTALFLALFWGLGTTILFRSRRVTELCAGPRRLEEAIPFPNVSDVFVRNP